MPWLCYSWEEVRIRACDINKLWLIENQTGDEESDNKKRDKFSHYFLMILTRLSRYIGLLSMELRPVGSIRGNGSDHLPPQDVYSKFWKRPPLRCSILTMYRALSHKYQDTGLKVYVNGDGADVYEDSFFKLAKMEDGTFNPTLILVGIRLGIDRVTPAYWQALKASLQLPQSVGIAGGRPSSSHYFFGIQGDHFFYLDPHITRPGLPFHKNSAELTKEEIDSCHTRRLRRLPLKDMDPSMLIAFLIKDEEDWESWRRAIGTASGKPVVHVGDKEPLLHGLGGVRGSVVDDVEILDDEDEESGEIGLPSQ